VLNGVDFSCALGSIDGILGENGAGKSTLIKILPGVLRRSEGEVRASGVPVDYRSPSEAARDGVICIFQQLSLMPDLSVADNIFIDHPPRRFGLIDRRVQRRMAADTLARITCDDVDLDALIRDLSLSRRQMVEIAKALSKSPKVLILDEATSALTTKDVETVYRLLGALRADGVACLFVSHRMQEVDKLCDRLSVFRNGQHTQTFDKGDLSSSEILQLMIGREISAQFPTKSTQQMRKPVLEATDLRWESGLKGINLTVGVAEILGLGGLDSQGHKELLLALFGVLKCVEWANPVERRAVQPDLTGPVQNCGTVADLRRQKDQRADAEPIDP